MVATTRSRPSHLSNFAPVCQPQPLASRDARGFLLACSMRWIMGNDQPISRAYRRVRPDGLPGSGSAQASDAELRSCLRGFGGWCHVNDQRSGREARARDGYKRRYNDELHAPEQSRSAGQRSHRHERRRNAAVNSELPGQREHRPRPPSIPTTHGHTRDGQFQRPDRDRHDR